MASSCRSESLRRTSGVTGVSGHSAEAFDAEPFLPRRCGGVEHGRLLSAGRSPVLFPTAPCPKRAHLGLGVGEDTGEGDGRADGALPRDRVLEHHDGGQDDDDALDTVADRVRHGRDALEDQVADLLVGMEAERSAKGPARGAEGWLRGSNTAQG